MTASKYPPENGITRTELVHFPRKIERKKEAIIEHQYMLIVDHKFIFHMAPKINIFDYCGMGKPSSIKGQG